MAAKQDLFDLIRSLDPSEKRFFRTFYSRDNKEENESPSGYLQLFNDMNNCKKYSEDKFLGKHAGKDYIGNFPYNKSNLYELVLDAMQVMRLRSREKQGMEFKIRSELDHAMFLREKLLNKACEKRLRKAKKEARRYQLHELLLEILFAERTHYFGKQDKGYEKKIEAIHSETEEILEKVRLKLRLSALRDRLFMIVRRQSRMRDEEMIRETEEIMADPLLKADSVQLDFDARNYFYFCHAIRHQLLGEQGRCWEFHKKIYENWVDYPHIREARAVFFQSVLNNYLNLCCEVGRFDRFEDAFGLLENRNFSSKEEAAEAEWNKLFLSVQYAVHRCDWDKALECEQEYEKIEAGQEPGLKLSRKIALCHSFAWLKLIQGEPSAARKWNNKILDMSATGVREGIRDFATILDLILHYEKGDVSMLETRHRSTIRRLRNKDHLYLFEKAVLGLLAELPGLLFSDRKGAFSAFAAKLEVMEAQPKQRYAHGFRIVQLWTQSKVEGRSLREVVEAAG